MLVRACLLAWRFGDESQQRVPPQVWQVRRWTHSLPIFTHSSHSRRFAFLTSVTLSRNQREAGANLAKWDRPALERPGSA